ncbi:hypothetical protein [Azospirillum endophyticum]
MAAALPPVRDAEVGAGGSVELSRTLLEQAFEMMGDLAARDGKVIDIAVYGGSCLLLAGNIRDVTRDVDAVFLSERSRGYELADLVGRRLGLPDDWLNQAVKSVAPPKGNPQPNLLPFGEYPKRGAIGLRIYLPTPEYMLAMKLLANRRDDPEGLARDRRDLHFLMEVTGLVTKEQLGDLVMLCYPQVPGLNPRIAAKIEDIAQGYAARECEVDRRSDPPSWNAGRGHPTL